MQLRLGALRHEKGLLLQDADAASAAPLTSNEGSGRILSGSVKLMVRLFVSVHNH